MAVLHCTAVFVITNGECVVLRSVRVHCMWRPSLELLLARLSVALCFRNRQAVKLLLEETRAMLAKNVPGLLSFEIAYGDDDTCVVKDAYDSVAALAASKPISVGGVLNAGHNSY